MLSGREWLCEFASKVTKHDYNTELTFYSKLIHPKRLRVSSCVCQFTLTQPKFHTISEEESFMRMACIERASPALKQILLKLYCAEKPLEIDHHLYEFGSVEYHIQSQASNTQVAYLSISLPPLCYGVLPNELSSYTIEMVKGLCPNVVEIVEPAKEGYQLTLKLNLNQIPRNKDYDKVIREISTVHSVILSSQLKEILWTVNSDDALQGMYKPIKLVYHPREPFFLIRQPQRIIAVFPIRFREKYRCDYCNSFLSGACGRGKFR
ncbi:Actin-related protein 2/3 complex subunit 2B [Spatholobus suberectus]|nr:Actin-related protein 2/3 complex subunit 2B [Spatholobus suberectus]